MAGRCRGGRWLSAEDGQASCLRVCIDWKVRCREDCGLVRRLRVYIGLAEVNEMHPHRVDGSVVFAVLILLRHGHYVVLVDNVRLASGVELLRHEVERHDGPEDTIQDSVIFVLTTSLCLGFSADATRVVQVHT